MRIPIFFKVVKVTRARVTLEEFEGVMVSPTDGGCGQQGYEMPDWSKSNGIVTARIYADGLMVKNSYGEHVFATLWDEKPVYADYCD